MMRKRTLVNVYELLARNARVLGLLRLVPEIDRSDADTLVEILQNEVEDLDQNLARLHRLVLELPLED